MFKNEYDASLNESLRLLGIEDAFNEGNVDLFSMSSIADLDYFYFCTQQHSIFY